VEIYVGGDKMSSHLVGMKMKGAKVVVKRPILNSIVPPNKKADLKSAFGVCPLFGAITLFTSSEARFNQKAYALKGFPILCFLLFGLNPFQDSYGFPNPIRL
jgi:hypothetical protein